jgi:hypothetical protein
MSILLVGVIARYAKSKSKVSFVLAGSGAATRHVGCGAPEKSVSPPLVRTCDLAAQVKTLSKH